MSISPADEFDNSQQIQIVKHANHFQAFIKNNDVIDRMEALKAKHKTKVERQKHVEKLREKNPKE